MEVHFWSLLTQHYYYIHYTVFDNMFKPLVLAVICARCNVLQEYSPHDLIGSAVSLNS